jgi:hypothetical protein
MKQRPDASDLCDAGTQMMDLPGLSTRLRANQRDSGLVARELGQLRVVPKPERQHVAIALDADRFPPAVLVALLRDDEVTRANVVPRFWQARRYRRQLFVGASRGLRFRGKLRYNLAI